jgi:hypothetical protein
MTIEQIRIKNLKADIGCSGPWQVVHSREYAAMKCVNRKWRGRELRVEEDIYQDFVDVMWRATRIRKAFSKG